MNIPEGYQIIDDPDYIIKSGDKFLAQIPSSKIHDFVDSVGATLRYVKVYLGKIVVLSKIEKPINSIEESKNQLKLDIQVPDSKVPPEGYEILDKKFYSKYYIKDSDLVFANGQWIKANRILIRSYNVKYNEKYITNKEVIIACKGKPYPYGY